ncbi:hypothetical protein EON66_00355 [archaeon]|nr:MAG: hypothetical protein EON66_00355 [archaeon]
MWNVSVIMSRGEAASNAIALQVPSTPTAVPEYALPLRIMQRLRVLHLAPAITSLPTSVRMYIFGALSHLPPHSLWCAHGGYTSRADVSADAASVECTISHSASAPLPVAVADADAAGNANITIDLMYLGESVLTDAPTLVVRRLASVARMSPRFVFTHDAVSLQVHGTGFFTNSSLCALDTEFAVPMRVSNASFGTCHFGILPPHTRERAVRVSNNGGFQWADTAHTLWSVQPPAAVNTAPSMTSIHASNTTLLLTLSSAVPPSLPYACVLTVQASPRRSASMPQSIVSPALHVDNTRVKCSVAAVPMGAYLVSLALLTDGSVGSIATAPPSTLRVLHAPTIASLTPHIGSADQQHVVNITLVDDVPITERDTELLALTRCVVNGELRLPLRASAWPTVLCTVDAVSSASVSTVAVQFGDDIGHVLGLASTSLAFVHTATQVSALSLDVAPPALCLQPSSTVSVRISGSAVDERVHIVACLIGEHQAPPVLTDALAHSAVCALPPALVLGDAPVSLALRLSDGSIVRAPQRYPVRACPSVAAIHPPRWMEDSMRSVGLSVMGVQPADVIFLRWSCATWGSTTLLTSLRVPFAHPSNSNLAVDVPPHVSPCAALHIAAGLVPPPAQVHTVHACTASACAAITPSFSVAYAVPSTVVLGTTHSVTLVTSRSVPHTESSANVKQLEGQVTAATSDEWLCIFNGESYQVAAVDGRRFTCVLPPALRTHNASLDGTTVSVALRQVGADVPLNSVPLQMHLPLRVRTAVPAPGSPVSPGARVRLLGSGFSVHTAAECDWSLLGRSAASIVSDSELQCDVPAPDGSRMAMALASPLSVRLALVADGTDAVDLGFGYMLHAPILITAHAPSVLCASTPNASIVVYTQSLPPVAGLECEFEASDALRHPTGAALRAWRSVMQLQSRYIGECSVPPLPGGQYELCIVVNGSRTRDCLSNIVLLDIVQQAFIIHTEPRLVVLSSPPLLSLTLADRLEPPALRQSLACSFACSIDATPRDEIHVQAVARVTSGQTTIECLPPSLADHGCVDNASVSLRVSMIDDLRDAHWPLTVHPMQVRLARSPYVSTCWPTLLPHDGGVMLYVYGNMSHATSLPMRVMCRLTPSSRVAVPGGTSILLPVTAANHTSVACNVPALAEGMWSVAVSWDGATFSRSYAEVRVVQRPYVLRLSPAFGSTLGGDVVHLTGAWLPSSTALRCVFGSAPPVPAHVYNASHATCVSPAVQTHGVAQAVAVSLLIDGAWASTLAPTRAPQPRVPAYFTYHLATELRTLAPMHGSSGGGTRVTLSGVGFVATGVSVCAFDGVHVPAQVMNSTTVVCTTPQLSPGTYTVHLLLNGRSAAFTLGVVTFLAYDMPTLAAIAPDSGAVAGGTLIMLQLTTHLPPAITVLPAYCTFDGVFVPAQRQTAHAVWCVTPRARTVVPHAVSVGLTFNAQDVTPSRASFHYVEAAVILRVSPASVLALHSEDVHITGIALPQRAWGRGGVQCALTPRTTTVAGVATTLLPTMLVPFTWLSPTLGTCTVPPLPTGSVDIVLMLSAVELAQGVLHVKVQQPGDVLAMAPVKGNVAGGTPLTLVIQKASAWLVNATAAACLFGGSITTPATVVATNRVTCTTPSWLSTQNVSVSVTLDGIHYSGTPFDFEYAAEPVPLRVSPEVVLNVEGSPLQVTGEHYYDACPSACSAASKLFGLTVPTPACLFTPHGTAVGTQGAITNAVYSAAGIACALPALPRGMRAVALVVTMDGLVWSSNRLLVVLREPTTLSAVWPSVVSEGVRRQVRVSGGVFILTPALEFRWYRARQVADGESSAALDAGALEYVAATPAAVINASAANCWTPALQPGLYALRLADETGDNSNHVWLHVARRASIAFISPPIVPTQGGVNVTVHGVNFWRSPHLSCIVGSHSAPAWFVSTTSITCLVPSGRGANATQAQHTAGATPALEAGEAVP